MCPSSKGILLNYQLSWDNHSNQDSDTDICLPSHPQNPLGFSSCLSTTSSSQRSAAGPDSTLVTYVSLGAFQWESFLSLFLDLYDLDIFEDYRLVAE